MARMRSINRAGTVPTIVVEGTVVAGFDAEALRAAVDRAARKHVSDRGGDTALLLAYLIAFGTHRTQSW